MTSDEETIELYVEPQVYGFILALDVSKTVISKDIIHKNSNKFFDDEWIFMY